MSVQVGALPGTQAKEATWNREVGLGGLCEARGPSRVKVTTFY